MTTTVTTRFCRDLAAGLADGGVTHVFVSPGSRNTPVTLAVLSERRITDISIRDERSAAFIALGYAKATGRPAAVVCTSGSAATHYFPAIVEADQSATPLIVITADRPASLRGTGAPQTMDQVDLYGAHVKRFIDADGAHDGRALGHLLVEEACALPPGPVHVNVAFDEPLVPDELPAPASPEPVRAAMPAFDGAPDILQRLEGDVLIVASGRQRSGFGRALERVASMLAAPVLPDPQVSVSGPCVIGHGDLLAGANVEDLTPILDDLRPDVVVRLGPIPTSKPLWEWLERSGVEQVLVESTRLADPLRSATVTIDADPTAFLEGQVLAHREARDFLDRWVDVDRIASMALDRALDALPWPNEPEVARSVITSAPEGTVVFLASSRPIRDADAFAPIRDDLVPLANRGVNGIDGTVSSAIGAAISGAPTILLVGDVAVLHDATALSEASRLRVPLRIVAINNDGGGIFSFLPQARSGVIGHEVFERHWGTPHGLSLSAVAGAMGMSITRTTDRDSFRAAVGSPIVRAEMIEIITDREANVVHHREIHRAVAGALRGRDEVE